MFIYKNNTLLPPLAVRGLTSDTGWSWVCDLIIEQRVLAYTKFCACRRGRDTCKIPFLCPCRVAAHDADRGSHSLTLASLLALAMTPREGCQSTHLTSPPCPGRELSQELVRKSCTLTVESSEQVANLRSVGEKDTLQQRSLCACRGVNISCVPVEGSL